MRALAQLACVPDARLRRHAAGLDLVEVPHPDAALLAICAELGRRQARWQDLWAACPDEQRGGPEDQALDDYSEKVWPATGLRKADDEDLPSQLLQHSATTPEGRMAKAAAVVAMEDAYRYLDIEICGRDDDNDLYLSALRDCAGEARIPVGEEAE